MRTIETDVLVCGAGIAGRTAALFAAQRGKKVLLTAKDHAAASDYVLGVNAPVSLDNVEQFVADTLRSGVGINDAALVRALADGSLQTVRLLEQLNIALDRNQNGYDCLKPLGCTNPRLVHAGNQTGRLAMDSLHGQLSAAGVEIAYEKQLAEIICREGRIAGALLWDSAAGELCGVRAKAVVVATGGVHLHTVSTYAESMTGDGIAAAYRAGAELRDMEFIQFEPCRAVWPCPLGLSTTLLAHGGTLINAAGERFLLREYPSEGAVSKDALAVRIAEEIAQGRGTPHGGIWLDLTCLPEEELKRRHSMYYERFMNAGIDLCRERVEVAPAAHSFLGGIAINARAETTVPGLFAAGEAAGGLHGANRIGGNAGSEIFVFGTLAGESAAEYCDKNQQTGFDFLPPKPTVSADWQNCAAGLRRIVSDCLGAVRSGEKLRAGLCGVRALRKQTEVGVGTPYADWLACRNLAQLAELCIRAALCRTESRGTHFRTDFPAEDPRQCRPVRWQKDKN